MKATNCQHLVHDVAIFDVDGGHDINGVGAYDDVVIKVNQNYNILIFGIDIVEDCKGVAFDCKVGPSLPFQHSPYKIW